MSWEMRKSPEWERDRMDDENAVVLGIHDRGWVIIVV